MTKSRYQIIIKGLVQGIGFRPFIYKLAQELNLVGWVNNSSIGVTIEIESSSTQLNNFIDKIKTEKPPQSIIDSIEINELTFVGYQKFTIKKSDSNHINKTALVLPDLSTCNDCLKEIFDSNNRRFYYPFTNCTNCGPRYSIITDLPYDREATTMKNFIMCEECQEEYNNPLNRRFHAQPNACAKCGPHIELWNKKGECIAKFDQALITTANLIKEGNIIAIKGLGGFHLMVNAHKSSAVHRLRDRKKRPHKPLAIMSPNLDNIKKFCIVSPLEKEILLSPASPIVLLKKRDILTIVENNNLCEEIAPNNPYLGVMLPYTPLHHLLLNYLNFPLVATSGNQKSEPICIDEFEALERLNFIADYFLIHNRPIFRAVDDSIVRVIDNDIMILRRGRGYAPLPITISEEFKDNSDKILALGGHLKNTVAIKLNNFIFNSQYIGDLDNPKTINAYHKTINNLSKIYDFEPDIIACDSHPNYYSTQYGETLNQEKKSSTSLIQVQHHLAHIFATIAEHNLTLPLLGIAWDGTGYGLDNTIWGGEFFYISEEKITRIASFLPFPLIGTNQAILQPKRIALALLDQVFSGLSNIPKNIPIINDFTPQELGLFQKMIDKQLNTPLTSSVGRLFDGIASLLNLIDNITFEGQGAMALEFLTDNSSVDNSYNFEWQYQPNKCNYIDTRSILQAIIKDYLDKETAENIARKFHLTLIEIIKQISLTINTKTIVLSGGCFQNKFLLENTIKTLRDNYFNPYWSQKIPINDGGLAVGQINFILRQKNK